MKSEERGLSKLKNSIRILIPEENFPTLYRIIRPALRMKRSVQRQARKINKRMFLQRDKRRLASHCAALHARAIVARRGKSRIRVVFLVNRSSTWKVDPLYRRMSADLAFETIVLVIPFVKQDPLLAKQTLVETEREFKDKGYRCLSSSGAEIEGRRVLDELEPDLVFMTNPHRVTLREFYEEVYENYVCFYVPYSHQIGSYDDNQPEFNGFFHNAMWRTFLPHAESVRLARKFGANRGTNVILTGYPACEDLWLDDGDDRDPWKSQETPKLRLIWAPHHTIDMPNLPYANFLTYAESFRDLAMRHRDRIQWAFKPHPLLRTKLYRHPDWGRERTESFFEFWSGSEHTQLEEGEYVGLFKKSSGMIHDSGSFLAEYLYVDKPVLYLQAVENIRDFLNETGFAAYAACRHARCWEDVETFVADMLAGVDAGGPMRRAFLETHVVPLFERSPSEKIIDEIRRSFPDLTGKVTAPSDASTK